MCPQLLQQLSPSSTLRRLDLSSCDLTTLPVNLLVKLTSLQVRL